MVHVAIVIDIALGKLGIKGLEKEKKTQKEKKKQRHRKTDRQTKKHRVEWGFSRRKSFFRSEGQNL